MSIERNKKLVRIGGYLLKERHDEIVQHNRTHYAGQDSYPNDYDEFVKGDFAVHHEQVLANSIRLNFSNDKFIELDFLTKDQNGEWIHIPFYRDSMGVTISSINEFSRVLISTKKKFELSEIACYSYKFYDVPKYAHTFFAVLDNAVHENFLGLLIF